MKKIISSILAFSILLSVAACSSGQGAASSDVSEAADSSESSGASVDTVPTIDQITLGTDYTDIKADLKFLTHKTDIMDTVFQDYIKEFQKLYPNINITYEGITNYEKEMGTRITTKDWGDICMVPAFFNTDKKSLGEYFLPLGDQKTLSDIYRYIDNMWVYDEKAYGVASAGNVQGLIYNKKVWKEAGVTELPKTPDEFLDDLQKIRDKFGDKVDPLYTNFYAQWTMTAWDAYMGAGATGDPDFQNITLAHMENPFTKRSDMTGPYAVYYTLYEAVKRGLTEADPTTTDWESSKTRLNQGEIGTMALGSWAITQCQSAGDNSDDVGYMPFPITVNGKQYALNGGDYNYCINVTSSKENQIAAMCYVKWLTEESGYAQSQGGIPALKTGELPEILKDTFKDVELLVDTPSKKGEEDLIGNLNSESELSLNGDPKHVSTIVEEAEKKDGKTLDQIVEDWNQRWTKAQKKYNALS